MSGGAFAIHMASEPSNRWQCSECGREFTRRTREHSCKVTTVESHLARASAESRATFVALQTAMANLGPFKTTALKTMITFSLERNFAGLTITKSRMDLGFFLGRRVQNGRITRIEPLSPTKVAHHVDLRSPSDVDAELVAWLAEAYEIGRHKHAK